MARQLKNTKLFKALRKDLIDQLERNGTIGAYYTDLVDDYMNMWLRKVALSEDVDERGEKVKSFKANGIVEIKNNDSIEMGLKINVQMLKLLAALKLEPSQSTGEDDEL